MTNPVNIHHVSAHKKRLLSALLITLVFTPLLVTAGIYKWTDENGNVHYGSQRPADATSERLKIKSGEQPYADKTTAKDKKEETGKKPGEENKEEKKAEAPKPPEPPKLSKKEKKSRCAQARKNLATIENRGRVRIKSEDGSSRHMTDKERSKRLARERKKVSKNCR